ncbi:MAG: HD domain-containing protein [Burkholderiales bacterium]|nr:HD domain-containing protein [Burkholderiales bacterium]
MNTPPFEAPFFTHADQLDSLNRSIPLDDKLAAIHEALSVELPFVDRISVAAYDAATDLLKTFLASSPGKNELIRYEARLSDSPSLAEIVRLGRPRVVNDLDIFPSGRHVHTAILSEDGFKSSYTVPIYFDSSFWGFIFFNSRRRDVFSEASLRAIDVYAHLISAVVTAEMLAVRVLAAAVKTALDMAHYRDPETGEHMNRVSRYARLIAQHLAATGIATLDDATIERIFQFAPLHDLGKLGVPDRVLLKPGQLTKDEQTEMRKHTVRGRDMIDAIAHNFGLEQLDGFDMLRHIAESHHENMDGSGYPHGLRGAEIPLEARIVAVADVFDALTSNRPYKSTWSNDEAFAWLRKLARSKFDEDCVEALIFNTQKVREIQTQFKDQEPA